jgi:hypothetical protein
MGFAFLDVAIGITFIYLLLSLICSAVNELISAILKARAGFLERGVIHLLEDKQFAETLYQHPFIRSLGGTVHPFWARLGIKEKPAYIPARNFALALMDMLKPGIGARDALTPAITSPSWAATSEPSGSHLLEALNTEPSGLPPGVRRALTSLVQAAGADAARSRQNIEDWYNSAMDRVSGAYKRRTQYTIFCIGLIVTIAINADSLIIFKRLTSDKTLAAAVSDTAEQYTRAQDASPIPIDATAPPEQQKNQAERELKRKLDTLDRLGLPIGWDSKDEATTPPHWPGIAHLFNAAPRTERLFLFHWPGWLLTAFAVSFGAPFWFDLLNRFIIVRSTVKPREKSQEETSRN